MQMILAPRVRKRLIPAAVVLSLGLTSLPAAAKVAHQGHLSLRDPNLRSASVLVVDPANSSVLLAKNADVAAPIASITKLMTALVVLDAGQSLDEPIDVTADSEDFGKASFSRLSVGTVLTRSDMMHLALMASENHAAQSRPSCVQ